MENIYMYDPKREYQNHKSEFDGAMNDVLNHGIFINGPEVAKIEQELASYVNVKHCIATSNGTDSLKLALLALHVGK